ncbi:unnamed protein product [Cuscuta epithymum]|uniref:Uncharacterized protein n=2 Tax=Cuscuta epithymum TaxID=186058 RepID=A0AAV0FY25_9ASTE|nr:unnamed protein product [Cuscuta epithymum]
MAIAVESSSTPLPLIEGSSSSPRPMGPSPSSNEHFWSTLRRRVDTLIEKRESTDQTGGAEESSKRMKDDALLLLRGFDSVSSTLSQLSDNIENALQGARDLANPSTLTEILSSNLEKYKNGENNKPVEEDGNEEIENKGSKRKFESSDGQIQNCGGDETKDENVKRAKELGKLKKARTIAISMAARAAAFARELKSLKSDLCFVQDRCSFLEEENRKLRNGIPEGLVPPEEDDDLVRLQLEALLGEKSRLANENASLNRENQCLRHLVEYHQFASEGMSASYENLLRGMGMSLDSPDDEQNDGIEEGRELVSSHPRDLLGVFKCLDECYDEY